MVLKLELHSVIGAMREVLLHEGRHVTDGDLAVVRLSLDGGRLRVLALCRCEADAFVPLEPTMRTVPRERAECLGWAVYSENFQGSGTGTVR